MAIRLKVKQLITEKCLKHCNLNSQEYNENRLIFIIRQFGIASSSPLLRKTTADNWSLRYLRTSKEIQGLPKLSPQEVTHILRENEYTQQFTFLNSVKSYDSNQLASNNPMEDTRTEARELLTTGMLLGVFDGHGGTACAQVIGKRLFDYITVCMLSPDLLNKYLASLETNQPLRLLETYNDKIDLIADLKEKHLDSFRRYVKEVSEMKSKSQDFQMKEVMEKAFLRLDDDISQEALQKNNGKINIQTLSVAVSGAVACVAHIDGPHLHVANVGDCQCVLGTLSDVNTWTANILTKEHNAGNACEVNRVLGEHPLNEKDTVIRRGRLLGQLAPLRALGDYQYKWSRKIISEVVKPVIGKNVEPPNYYTPPYLSACPEVIYHQLIPRDKFLIIASDGLWDLLTPVQAVRLVGNHMSERKSLSFPSRNKMTISQKINTILIQKNKSLTENPYDTNAATHLIRNALGGTKYGIDHEKLTLLLTIPDKSVRLFRDDITVTVIYFHSEFLKQYST